MVEDSSVQLCFLNELSKFDICFIVQVEGNHDPNHVQEDEDKPEILEFEIRVKPWWPILCVCVGWVGEGRGIAHLTLYLVVLFQGSPLLSGDSSK